MAKAATQIAGAAVTGLILVIHARAYLLDPSFWAEDLRVFWLGEFVHSIGGVILSPYAGYLHLVPRLVAWAAWLTPVADHPIFSSGLPSR